ncbi:MAG: Gfo/Idh/MocA family oxidoreductase [Actinomycetia bacterium]|nr:Gfo/Idh/MocA family oxidoreductase [Actinomycetes bacterium]
MTVALGVIGTSWWADAMYLPALANSQATVMAVAGRNQARTDDFASRWGVANACASSEELLSIEDLEAVVIASPNDTHYQLALEALERGLHVLCEKPLALDLDQARTLVATAGRAGAITMVPFTYRFMPTNQWVKRLIDDGFIGQPYHLDLRYFTGFARAGEYNWRFDQGRSGSGVLGDLGSHWLHLARWLFGDIVSISAQAHTFVKRQPRPDGTPYTPTEDWATMTVRFASGAVGNLQVSAVAHAGDGFGQTHHLDAHGSGGTLHAINDWSRTQCVSGLRSDEPGPAYELPVPDDVWGMARRESVHDTYRDVFRHNGAMVGDFVDAVAEGRPCEPDFAEGLRVQKLLDAALRSIAQDGRMVTV